MEGSQLSDADLIKKSLQKLKVQNARIKELELAQDEPLAVVGMAGRFPDADNLEEFWTLLTEGRDAIKELPEKRIDRNYWSDYLSKTTTLKGGFLKGDVYGFDTQYFGISPREAQYLDPQQRILLEVCLEAFENAHIDVDELKGSNTGVYLGMSTDDYSRNLSDVAVEDLNAYMSTGNANSTAAGRVSYTFGLTGPCMTVDTACSSSLVAMHQAISGLRHRECDSAVVAGVGLILSLYNIIFFSQAGMLSPTGRCNTFDRSADGYVRGEGCGVVVLKRLSDAQRNGDNIIAVVRGSAINQDGASAGLTVPNGTAQASLIRNTIKNSKLTPDDIDYVEAHGTGTNLGDPIELTALGNIFATKTRKSCLKIGSVKTNIGHLEAAAGIASFIKMCLSLQHNQLPPHLHCSEPTEHVDWQSLKLKVNSSLSELSKPEKIGRVGISSFGFSGTNVHVILEQAPTELKKIAADGAQAYFSRSMLLISAKSKESFEERVLSYRSLLLNSDDTNIPDLCFSSQLLKQYSEFYAVILVSSKIDAIGKLNKLAARESSEDICFIEKRDVERNKIAYVFNAKLQSASTLIKSLYPCFNEFKIVVDNCEKYLNENYASGFLQNILSDTEDLSVSLSLQMRDCVMAASQLALARLWSSWGVNPAAVSGVAGGDIVAACVAEIFDQNTMIDLLLARSASSGEVLDTAKRNLDGIKFLRPVISYIHATKNETNSESLLTASNWLTDIDEKYSLSNQAVLLEIGLSKCVLLDAIGQAEGSGSDINTGFYWSVFSEASMKNDDEESLRLHLQKTLVHVFSRYSDVQWKLCDPASGRNKIALPDYPFNRTSYCYVNDSQANGSKKTVGRTTATADNESINRKLKDLVFDNKRQANDIVSEMRSLLGEVGEGKNGKLYYQRRWQLLENDLEDLAEGTATSENMKAGSTALIFADSNGIADLLEGEIRKSGRKTVPLFKNNLDNNYVAVMDALESIVAGAAPTAIDIIYLWEANNSNLFNKNPAQIVAAIRAACEPLLAIATVMTRNPRANITLSILTFDNESSDPGYPGEEGMGNLIQSSLLGMAQTFAIEMPDSFSKIICMAENPAQNDIADIVRILNTGTIDRFLSYREMRVHALRVAESSVAENIEKFSENGSKSAFGNDISKQYLITGGFGHIGMNVIRHLVKKGAGNFIIVSRNSPSENVQSQLTEFGRQGIKIEQQFLDIADSESVDKLFKFIGSRSAKLAGVVHCAGSVADGFASNMQWEKFSSVLQPKVLGAWNLHQQTRNLPLDFFVMFSSAASFLGSPGQSNYVVANSFMDALAHRRKSLGLPALAINWGPWQDGGMAESLSDLQRERQRASGMHSLSVDTAMQAFDQLLSTDMTQVAVMDLNVDVIKRVSPPALSQLLSDLNGHATEEPKNDNTLDRLKALSGDPLKAAIKSYISKVISGVMKLTEDQLKASENLLELGMDSLMAMEILTTVKTGIHLNLYPREIYENPRLTELAEYVAVEFKKYHGDGESSGEVVPDELFDKVLPQRFRRTFTSNSNVTKTSGVAFILSSPRSGSTLLRSMLAGHSKLFSPPELHLLPFEGMADRDKELKGSYMDEGLVRSVMELTGKTGPNCQLQVQKWIDENRPVSEIYKELHALCGERLLIDKSPSYGDDIAVLQRAESLFDKPKYIHLTRHPLSVIESFARMRMNNLIGLEKENPYQVAEKIWMRSNENIRQFFNEDADADRCLTVAYEDLVGDPKRTMQVISQFLGIDVEESMLHPYGDGRMTDGVTEKSLSIGDPNFLNHSGVVVDMVERWKSKKLSYTLNHATHSLASVMNYSVDIEEAVAFERKESVIEANGHKLCISEWGRPEDPLIVCIHGIMDQGPIWEECASALVKQGYRVVAPDLRGHGLSSHSDEFGGGQITDLVADLDSLAISLGAEKFTLVGHSMGTIVTSLYAACRPELLQRLILVEPVLPTPNRYSYAEHLKRRLALNAIPSQHPRLATVAEAIGRLERAHPTMPQAQLSALATRMLKQNDDHFVWTWDPRLTKRSMLNFAGKGREDYLDVLDAIAVPITLVFGNESPFNRTDDLAQLKKRLFQAATYELAGSHGIHYEQPIELANIISHQVKIVENSQKESVMIPTVQSVARKKIYQIDKV